MEGFSFDDLVKKADHGQSRYKSIPQIPLPKRAEEILHSSLDYFVTSDSTSKDKGTYDYFFNFAEGTWKETKWVNGVKSERKGKLSDESMKHFADHTAFILNLPQKQFITNTKSSVITTDPYEKEVFGPIASRPRCEVRFASRFFRWIGNVDTDSPFKELYENLEKLREEIR